MRSEIEMALFEPSAVLPPPMSVGARLVSDISGPSALMLAVLKDAVRYLERGRRCGVVGAGVAPPHHPDVTIACGDAT